MIKFLLAHGANPAVKGAAGETPLDVADGARKLEVCERLSSALALSHTMYGV